MIFIANSVFTVNYGAIEYGLVNAAFSIEPTVTGLLIRHENTTALFECIPYAQASVLLS